MNLCFVAGCMSIDQEFYQIGFISFSAVSFDDAGGNALRGSPGLTALFVQFVLGQSQRYRMDLQAEAIGNDVDFEVFVGFHGKSKKSCGFRVAG